jgi:hypothetical protein
MTKHDVTFSEIREALANTLKKAIDEHNATLATPEEIRQGLIGALHERIDTYKAALVKMREREIGHDLKKNADMGYGAGTMPPAPHPQDRIMQGMRQVPQDGKVLGKEV